MPAKQTKDHVIKKCPKCGVRNRICLDPLPKKIRCGECKEELVLPRPIKAKPVEKTPSPKRQAISIAKEKAAAAAKATSTKVESANMTTAMKSSSRVRKTQKIVTKKPEARNPEPAEAEDAAVAVTDSTFLTNPKAAITEVSFDDAMRITPLLSQVSKQAQFSLRSHLVSHGCDVLAGALAGASLCFRRGAMVVRFSEKGRMMLNAGQLTMMKGGLPTLVDASGRVVEQARRLGPLATSTRIAANLWMAAVTIAHIISGADIAKKINKLDAKVDFLVAGRRIDQLARIEGVYRQAREILHLEQNSYTQWELQRLGRELFEVRSVWRREIAHHVGQLQKTEESENWLVGFFQDFTRKGKDEKVVSVVSACDAELQLISGSIAIHLALSQAAGTLDTFLQVSLPDEITEMDRVRSLIHERRHFIHEKHPELRDSVSAVCSQLDEMTRIYRPMVIPRD